MDEGVLVLMIPAVTPLARHLDLSLGARSRLYCTRALRDDKLILMNRDVLNSVPLTNHLAKEGYLSAIYNTRSEP